MRSGIEHQKKHRQSSCAARSSVANLPGGFSGSRGCPMRSAHVSRCPYSRRNHHKLTSTVNSVETAAISSSLEALTGSDKPSFTNRMVSPR